VPSSSVVMETEGFSETLLLFYQTVRRNIQDDCNLTDTVGSNEMQ